MMGLPNPLFHYPDPWPDVFTIFEKKKNTSMTRFVLSKTWRLQDEIRRQGISWDQTSPTSSLRPITISSRDCISNGDSFIASV